MLSRTLDGVRPRFGFRAVSWQDLVPQLPLDDQVREWAQDKHGLPVVAPTARVAR